jgi:hypothetical protein
MADDDNRCAQEFEIEFGKNGTLVFKNLPPDVNPKDLIIIVGRSGKRVGVLPDKELLEEWQHAV